MNDDDQRDDGLDDMREADQSGIFDGEGAPQPENPTTEDVQAMNDQREPTKTDDESDEMVLTKKNYKKHVLKIISDLGYQPDEKTGHYTESNGIDAFFVDVSGRNLIPEAERSKLPREASREQREQYEHQYKAELHRELHGGRYLFRWCDPKRLKEPLFVKRKLWDSRIPKFKKATKIQHKYRLANVRELEAEYGVSVSDEKTLLEDLDAWHRFHIRYWEFVRPSKSYKARNGAKGSRLAPQVVDDDTLLEEFRRRHSRIPEIETLLADLETQLRNLKDPK